MNAMLATDSPAAVASLYPLGKLADRTSMRAMITVTDAAGRVLCRRPATEAEVIDALAAVEVAEVEGAVAMERIARERANLAWFEAIG